ncbi:unnamed protein product [Ilex paraguariensis]|uniref:Katanin p80 WD40 repeat-containing subunit B1 homolog n=1 Tax=Ilex paraguariensis TaxID=185542 RepID=A0ABC8SFM0_9AQUA
MQSLCGHASPVESVAFDSAEALALAGASAGVMKLWDLEETKMVRTLNGHRSHCTAVEFHPFGEFFASGSMDTNLKIWDIRKKGCIHTYKGHTRGISTIRFTPDGRWVVSGGYDNVVKVWDLTAGKLLHDFKFHEGHIRSMDFHPLEFLLATGSADRTVKFWDLETFELIGSAKTEFEVYSWEPVICHDAVDMGWSTLGDTCIHDGKLLGCSYYRNSVGVWVADVMHIEPYGGGLVPDKSIHSEQKYDLQESPLDKIGGHRRSTSNLRCISPDYETKEIKNIYVDTTGRNPVARKSGSFTSPKVVLPSDLKDMNDLTSQKQSPAVGLRAKITGQANSKSFIIPNVVPRDIPEGRDSTNSRRESIVSVRASTGMPLKPTHRRRPSNTKIGMDRVSTAVESGSFDDKMSTSDIMDQNFRSRLGDDARESSEEKHSNMKNVAEKFETISSPKTPFNPEICVGTVDCSKAMDSVKIVNGVAILQGRTRSLVQRFEGRERLSSDEVETPDLTPHKIPEPTMTSPLLNTHPQSTEMESTAANDDDDAIEGLMRNHDVFLSTVRSRLTKLQVLQHFWERNDIKGAIMAMRKLPDHSVQADIVGVLMEKMEIVTLDLFSCLLPVLLGLLDSMIERHASVSLEILLKLVAVFGPLVYSTISAPPAVGVNLQAEQRLECCNQCFIQLQKIQKILPALARKGGLLATCAQELNLVLQES